MIIERVKALLRKSELTYKAAIWLFISVKEIRKKYLSDTQILLKIEKAKNKEIADIVQSDQFVSYLYPTNKFKLGNKRKKIIYSQKKFEDKSNDFNTRLKSLLICMVTINPYEMDSDKLIDFGFGLGKSFRKSIFIYFFNTFVLYQKIEESNKHAIFLSKAIERLYKDLSKASLSEATDCIDLFATCFTGSIQIANTSNMKNLYVNMRNLLEFYLNIKYKIPDFTGRPVRKRSGDKIKVGLLRHSFNGELLNFEPLYTSLDFNKYDVHIYVFSKDGIERIRDYPNIKYHILSPNNIEESLLMLRGEMCDILIQSSTLSGNFLDPVAMIFTLRASQCQLTNCVDITTTGIKNIDYFVIGQRYSKLDLKSEMSERLSFFSGVGWTLPKAPIPTKGKKEIRRLLGVGADEILYVSNAHIFKLTPETIRAWVKILCQKKESKILLMPFNSLSRKKQFGEKFLSLIKDECKKYSLSIDRFIIIDTLGSHNCINYLVAGDIYLDCFPYAGPTSSCESLSLGIPVVTMTGAFYRNSLTAGFLLELNLKSLIATDERDYIKKVMNLSVNKNELIALNKIIKKRIANAPFYDNKKAANEWGRLFCKLTN